MFVNCSQWTLSAVVVYLSGSTVYSTQDLNRYDGLEIIRYIRFSYQLPSFHLSC